MKKIVLAIVAMLCMTMARAENENLNATNATSAYAFNVNMKALANTLMLTSDQFDAVSDIQTTFNIEMMNAGTADRADRTELTKTAVKHCLRRLSQVLDRDQMRKYISILNASFNNRGISLND
ncbi:MAG: hypothetical protein ACI3Y5_10240 [Prevotella sp.]